MSTIVGVLAMAENERRMGLIDRITNRTSAVTGLITAVTTLAALLGIPADWMPWVRWVVVVLLAVAAVYFLLSAFAGRSRLVQPDRFRIRAEEPRFLKGRESEVEELGELCARSPLVFLVAESGCGKSALVRAGLVPWCRPEKGRPLPLVVDLSGAPWDAGLADLVARVLWNDHEALCRELGSSQYPQGDAVFDLLAKIKAHTPRVPLVVFDQCDDYQRDHRPRFYKRSRLLKAEEVLAANGFWRCVAQGAKAGQWHCLLVTRDDTGAGLAAFRFCDEETFLLSRVDSALIAPLLDEITTPGEDGKAVVERPEKGWLQLRDRLLADLGAEDRRVLPIQLAVALDALRRRPWLTVEQYRRDGGLSGLERLHVQGHVADAARVTGVAPATLYAVLLRMVDAERQKTRRVSREDIESLVPEDQRPALESALKRFEHYQLIRRVAGESPKRDSYLLYHDYLARGVLQAHLHTAEWRVRLEDRARQWRRALGWREKWRTLLGVPVQVRLAWERLRGRLRYGEHRAYAAWSVLPWVLLVLAVLVCAGLVRREVRLASARQVAREAIAALDGEPLFLGMSENALSQLWALAASDWGTRKEAVRLALADPGAARRALPYAPMLAHAAVGLDPFGKRSSELLSQCLEPAVRGPEPTSEVVFLAAELLVNLNVKGALGVAKELLKRIQTDEYKTAPIHLSEARGALAAMLDPRDVPAGANSWVSRRRTERNTEPVDDGALLELRERLHRLGVDFDPKNVQPAAAALVKAMEEDENSLEVAKMGRALGTLAAKLEPKDVRRAAAALVNLLEKEQIGSVGDELGTALGTLAAKLDAKDLRPGAAALAKSMEKSGYNAAYVARVGIALGTLAARLEPKDLRPGAAALLKGIETERDLHADELLDLGEALGRLRSGLSEAELSHAAETLSARLPAARYKWMRHREPDDGEGLAELFAAADHQLLVDLLKSMPGGIPRIRRAVVDALELKTGAKFDGNLWKFVDWATTDPEGRALKVRLE